MSVDSDEDPAVGDESDANRGESDANGQGIAIGIALGAAWEQERGSE